MNIFIALTVFISGLILSFGINFLCDGLPLTVEDEPRKLSPRPVCVHCKKDKTWKDFLTFHACPECGKPVPVRHWVVLVIVPITYLASYVFLPDHINWWLTALLIFYFYLVAIIDISHRIILFSLTLIGWVLTALVGYLIHGLPLTLLGGGSALILLLLLYYAGVLFSKIMEKRRGEPVDEALGFGDVYISIMAGFLLAFPDVFSALILAILFGGVTSLIFLVSMLVRKDYRPLTPIPYAPFIILATIVLLYRQGI